jgi:hypothetical protein
VVVSEWEKLRQDRGKVCIEEMSASEPPFDVSKVVLWKALCKHTDCKWVLLKAAETTIRFRTGVGCAIAIRRATSPSTEYPSTLAPPSGLCTFRSSLLYMAENNEFWPLAFQGQT